LHPSPKRGLCRGWIQRSLGPGGPATRVVRDPVEIRKSAQPSCAVEASSPVRESGANSPNVGSGRDQNLDCPGRTQRSSVECRAGYNGESESATHWIADLETLAGGCRNRSICVDTCLSATLRPRRRAPLLSASDKHQPVKSPSALPKRPRILCPCPSKTQIR
jgi:hypothetical protein